LIARPRLRQKSLPFKKFEDLREVSASSPIVPSILGHEPGLASHCEVKVRTEPLP